MYIVEGNIGAGKSTFLTLLAQHKPKISVVLEPVNKWQNSQFGSSLLSNFYQEPQRWAYSLETFTLINRVQEHIAQQKQNNSHLILERSIYSGNYCFAQNSYQQGFLSEVEWQIYGQWFSFLTENKCKAPLGFIYLKVDPRLALERIKKRSRDGETTISLEYLQQIDQKHEHFLTTQKKTIPSLCLTPVLTLDCNTEFETNHSILLEHFQKIEQFMISTQQKFQPAVTDWKMLRRSLIDDTQNNSTII